MPDPFDKEQAQELVEDIEGDLLRLARIHGDLEKSDELIRKWDQQDISVDPPAPGGNRGWLAGVPA